MKSFAKACRASLKESADITSAVSLSTSVTAARVIVIVVDMQNARPPAGIRMDGCFDDPDKMFEIDGLAQPTENVEFR